MSKSKGATYERRLVNLLADAEYAVMRSPSSGSATTRDQPDVLAVNRQETLAIEVKYHGTPDGIVYLDDDELSALARFANDISGEPLVAVRWKRDPTFYLFGPESLEDTQGDSDRKRVTRERVATARSMLADGSCNSPGLPLDAAVDERLGQS